jgi:hypothetical protein
VNQLLKAFDGMECQRLNDEFLDPYFLVSDYPQSILTKLHEQQERIRRMPELLKSRSKTYVIMKSILMPCFVKMGLLRILFFLTQYGNFLILDYLTAGIKDYTLIQNHQLPDMNLSEVKQRAALLSIILLISFLVNGLTLNRFVLNRTRLENQALTLLRLMLFEKTLKVKRYSNENESEKGRPLRHYLVISLTFENK